MDDYGMPLVELRLKGLGKQIVHYFTMYEGELNGSIKRSVEALMTNENIQREIDRLCYDCMKECIKEVFNSTAVRSDLITIMTEQVLARISGNTPMPTSAPTPYTAPTSTGTPLPQQAIVTSQTEDEFWTSVKKEVGGAPYVTG
jgi:hypothetical protein